MLTATAVPLCAIVLSSCSLLGWGGSDGEVPAPPAPSEQPPEVETVRQAVERIVEPDSHPSSEAVFAALEDAGYDPEQLEATVDASPLSNEVPAKVFAVRTDDGCIVGEIRQGSLTVAMERPVESLEVCLFGDVDRPEGVEPPEGDPVDGEDDGAGHLPGESIESSDGGSDSGSGDSGSESGDSGSEGGDSSSEGGGLGGN